MRCPQVHEEHAVRFLRLETSHLAGTPVTFEELLPQLVTMFERRQLSFPWKHLYITQDNALDMMAALRTHQASWSIEPCSPHNVRFLATDAVGNPLFPLNFQGGFLGVNHPEKGTCVWHLAVISCDIL